MSGETAAIGLGFILGGPIGAIIGGTVAPAALAALMWRSRNAEHDENSNDTNTGNGSSDSSGSRDRAGGPGDRGRGNGRGNGGGGGRNNGNGSGSGGGRHKAPKSPRNGASGGTQKKPKTKDPIADKLGKLGKDLAGKLKPNKAEKDKARKNGKEVGGTDPKSKTDKAKKDKTAAPWTSSPDGLDPKKPKDKKDRRRNARKEKDDDASSWTARDGLAPKGPKGGGDDLPPKPDYDPDEYVDAELVDDDMPSKPGRDPGQVIDADVVDEDRIALVRAKRERDMRRRAISEGKKAAEKAARDGNLGDPHRVKLEVTRQANYRIDRELHHQKERLALTAAAETPRSTPVNYPAIQAAPAGTRTADVAIARQVDFRGSTAYAILRAMADQIAHGLHHDADADMADHIVELTGIPNMCKNLSVAVQEAARALARTAPLHPSVIKHLNNAAVAARSAGLMADNIMIVFVQAHREDIIRVLDPRIGEERWNLRNAPGTLDAAKLRAAIASAHTARLALPAGAAPAGGGSKLVPASDGSTKKLINLMKGFTRGHMVNVLSEVAGSAAGVEAVAESVTKLYRRMVKTWPTEGVVDDTVRATASKVRTVSDELKKAIRAAQRAHQRELKLNAKPRKGARAESKWDVATGRGASN
ncbi:hypothetical protein ACWD4O_39120 [Streptomyces sp. NPDC002623]